MDKTDFLAKSDKITSVFSPLPPGEGGGEGRQAVTPNGQTQITRRGGNAL